MPESVFDIRDRIRAYYQRDALSTPVQTALEDTVDRTRDAIQSAARKRWSSGENGPWVFVEDFHDEWAIIGIEHSDGTSKSYRHGYSWSDGMVVLSDQGEEVVRRHVWEKAFVSEINGKTILTAPVKREQAASNPMFLNLHGRFVGAEKANRNGALWTTGDLEMGQPTVTHGPLNWLHEERYIIGALTKSSLIDPAPTVVASEQSFTINTSIGDPYLAVDSVVWKWIYPHEAATIEMASEQGKLWYSMECIAENVHCGECGESYPYMQAQRASGEVCDHIRDRTASRRMENPTFLGGAVIVPPVRPGWADANLEVMKAGSVLAEAAYEQSGSSVAAREWEVLMAQLVRFAS